MKARYLGNPTADSDGPRRVGFAGKSFPRGIFVDISDIPEKLAGKLKTNPYFEVSDEALSADEQSALDDANGDGEDAAAEAPAAGKPGDKKAVIAALEAMQERHPEVTFQPKWSLAKLQETLEAAQFEHGDED